MTQVSPTEAPLVPKNLPEIESKINPWLTRILYPLASYGVIPSYFDEVNVTGRENIPLEGPVIVAPLHRSRWDALVIPYAVGRLITGRDLRFMVSANEMKGLQGWFVKRMGGFPVNTDHPGLSSVAYSIDLLSQGEMVVIFPEGGIFRDESVHPLKPGVARIALEVETLHPDSEIKILPVSVWYDRPYPKWHSKVNLKIGEPINVKEFINAASIKRATVKLNAELTNRLKFIHEQALSSLDRD
ncbi:MAG: hypothetical protein N5P05_002074 [Chroococcopsis gigantea SAG 12.99]|jgi:1-acyl-sn-glycerol-3-phosphate acyltransferase|nr:1-acyl-sn-glycerol-3-phosphate acyltransferase [Chlorogloea purpurea SAG 13.99]MDV3000468.1 hypothetical protein [Chroococcopsis gigantea SAG 12.99]